jgi:hypothetical protein
MEEVNSEREAVSSEQSKSQGIDLWASIDQNSVYTN